MHSKYIYRRLHYYQNTKHYQMKNFSLLDQIAQDKFGTSYAQLDFDQKRYCAFQACNRNYVNKIIRKFKLNIAK